MRFSRTLELVDVHCEGEVGKVITGGVIDLPGETMADKLTHINETDDFIRRFVTREPRACLPMSVNLLLPPSHPDADAGFIILQSDKAHAMSGSNSICLVTALLELGYLPMTDEQTPVVLDTAAGLVHTQAICRDGACKSVTLGMPDAFVYDLDHTLDVSGVGRVSLDIAYGGVFYGLVDVEPLGLEITPSRARDLARAGQRILSALKANGRVRHPQLLGEHDIAYVMFRQPVQPGHFRTCTVLPPGRVDRSPCGTGSSAHMAALHARNELEAGDDFISESITGGQFRLHCQSTEQRGGMTFVHPHVTGRAWIFGFQQLGLDPDDPLSEGFTVNDTWGVA